MFVLEVLLGTLGLRALLSRWLKQRRYRQAQRYLSKGMELLAIENYAPAEKVFVRSAQ
ncbi:MAG: hypothetical protein IPG70_04110 [Moraxellaceae bacterium]|nr:hypothetical protein [Moraxellaceae bacterium]